MVCYSVTGEFFFLSLVTMLISSDKGIYLSQICIYELPFWVDWLQSVAKSCIYILMDINLIFLKISSNQQQLEEEEKDIFLYFMICLLLHLQISKLISDLIFGMIFLGGGQARKREMPIYFLSLLLKLYSISILLIKYWILININSSSNHIIRFSSK